jgi:hypothetical protein
MQEKVYRKYFFVPKFNTYTYSSICTTILAFPIVEKKQSSWNFSE